MANHLELTQISAAQSNKSTTSNDDDQVLVNAIAGEASVTISTTTPVTVAKVTYLGAFTIALDPDGGSPPVSAFTVQFEKRTTDAYNRGLVYLINSTSQTASLKVVDQVASALTLAAGAEGLYRIEDDEIKAVISSGGGTDSNAIHGNTPSEISAITEKTTPVSADLLLIEDSAASNAKKKVQIGNLPASGASVNAQTGTTYTLALSDANNALTMNNASANTLTIPTNASVAFPVGTVISIIQLGAGTTTVTGDTGVSVNGTSAGSADLSAQHSAVSLLKIATNSWNLSGGHGGVT